MNRWSDGVDGSAPRPFPIALGGGIAFVVAFLFRFLSAEFTNDPFMHLAEAAQVLHGEWPVRDYFDFGLPLQVLTSAATLAVTGHNLFGEALVTVSFIAAGVALTFILSAHLSRSLLIAGTAAAIALLSAPRLYNYPKAFFYVFALWAAWSYATHPDLRRRVLLAAAVGVAFLYRHDHGLYIGVSSIALFVVLYWRQTRAGVIAFAQYAGIILLVIAPFFAFVQSTIGLPWYLGDLKPGADASIGVRFNVLPITVDRSAPRMTIEPATARRFHVRWTADIGDADRASLERKYHLSQARFEGGSTWSYSTGDETHANIRRLVDDPAVADTNGIDRAAGTLAAKELWYESLQRRIPLLRMRLLPGLFARGNAIAFFYYITWAVPVIGLAAALIVSWRNRITRPEAAVAWMSVLLSLIVVETLVRGSPDSRLPDVVTVICVTGAWTAGRLYRASPSASRPLTAAALVGFGIVSLWSVGTNAQAGEMLNASRLLTGPSGIAWRFEQMQTRLQRRPIDTWADDDPGYRGLTRYVFACTTPDDRVLVTWFEPIISFYAEREFAGGRVFFDGGWHDSIRDQQFTVARLHGQSVPIVLIRDDYERMFRKYFPLVAGHVDRHYTRSEPSANPAQISGYQVWVSRARPPVRTYERLGLPCYR
jgi:hypothetical protein